MPKVKLPKWGTLFSGKIKDGLQPPLPTQPPKEVEQPPLPPPPPELSAQPKPPEPQNQVEDMELSEEEESENLPIIETRNNGKNDNLSDALSSFYSDLGMQGMQKSSSCLF